MDFIYEEEAIPKEPSANEQETQNDSQVEQVFTKLENEVTRGYEKTTEVINKYIHEDEEGIHLELPIDPAVAEKAQQYLKTLDNNLQNVEAVAQNYWTKVSNPGFWASISTSLGLQLDKVVQLGTEGVNNLNVEETLEVVDTPINVAGNRTDAELRELATKKDIYIDNKLPLDPEFDADAKTDEISKILEADTNLSKLMNEIVPQNIPYKEFWNIYFINKNKILEMEEKRKKILEDKESEKEISGWDDEDEDDISEQPVIIEKEDVIESATEEEKPTERLKEIKVGSTFKGKEESPVGNSRDDKAKETKDSDDDDDDDDWE